MRTVRATCCLAFVLLVSAGIADGSVLQVPSQYGTIQEAVDAAQYGDEIEIAAGNYDDVTHFSNLPNDSTLCVAVLKSGLTIRGAGIGATIINPDSLGRGFFALGCEDLVIEDLTVTRGFAAEYGAGILCDSTKATFQRIEATSNFDGAIILLNDSEVELLQCVMTENASKTGSGIDVGLECNAYLYQCDILDNGAPFAAGARVRGQARFEECLFQGNVTDVGTNLVGGGLLIKEGADVLLLFCDIIENTASGHGGGLAIEDEFTHVDIVHCTISDNLNTGDEGIGGGIFVGNQAKANVRWCTITGNSTTGEFSNGGGVGVDYANIEMAHCTLYNNWTEGAPGDYTGHAGQLGLFWLSDEHTAEFSHLIVTDSPQGQEGVYCSGDPLFLEFTCCDVWNNAGSDDICGSADPSNFSLDPLYCNAGAGDLHIDAASPCGAGNHPNGPAECDGQVIGAYFAGCTVDVPDDPAFERGLLLGNEPNPFSQDTMIRYELHTTTDVKLEVFDISGRRVAKLADGVHEPGTYQANWDGSNPAGERLPAGVYFYQLSTGKQVQGRQMLYFR